MNDGQPRRVLLIGYGNPGRLDDGLGPCLANALADRDLPGLTVDSDYQLTVEDAHDAAQYDVVIFADADVSGPEPFHFSHLNPGSGTTFSSHSVEAGDVIALARQLFKAKTEAYALGIRGYEFNEFEERLSDKARRNLDQAIAFVERLVQDGSFEQSAGPADSLRQEGDRAV